MDELLKLRGPAMTVDQIMEVFGEAREVHQQALIAMGQQTISTSTPVVSTEGVINLTPDFSSRTDHG